MNTLETAALHWGVHTLLGGGLLLLLAWTLLRRLRQPARRQRLAEGALLAALVVALLSLAPAWLIIPLPASPTPEAVATSQPVPAVEVPLAADLPVPGQVPEPLAPEAQEAPQPGKVPAPLAVPADPGPSAPPIPVPPASPPLWPGIGVVLLGVYAAGSLLLLGHWLLGHVALGRLLRETEPAPKAVRRMARALAGKRCPRLLVSRRIRVPFSLGLWRPVVVLPVALCEDETSPALRWVLVHELAHVQRRDAWACWLFGLGQVVFFVLPWFWWLRRQVRLNQEYIADAAAVAAGGRPEDYAQFLLGLTTAPALPAGVMGVVGPSSDLYRRITMLLQSPVKVERRCPRTWSLLTAGGLLGLAVLAAGLGLQAAPVPEPKKDEPSKIQPAKPPEPAKPADADKKNRLQFEGGLEIELPDLEKLIPNLQGLDADSMKQLREHFEKVQKEVRKALEEARKGGGLEGFGRLVIPAPGLGNLQLQGRLGLNRGLHRQEGRLGVRVEAPSTTMVEQLDLPKNQGLIVAEVETDSAAAKAGLKAHDILLEVNGKPVPSKVEEFAKQLDTIKANTPVDAVVLRKGKKETIKGLSLPEAKEIKRRGELGINFLPALPNFPGNFIKGQNGNGVMTSTFRTNDRFTTRHQEGNLVITVTGKVDQGKSTVSEINVQDGGVSNKFDSVDKVPEQYRDKVKNLVEMSTKGVQVQITP